MKLTDMATAITFDNLSRDWLSQGNAANDIRRIWEAMRLSQPDDTCADDFHAQAIAQDWTERATGHMHADYGLAPSPERDAYRADVRPPLPQNKLVTIREVTSKECHWLDADVDAGTVVNRFDGCTYGCVSPGGRAVTFVDGGPFIELPADALTHCDDGRPLGKSFEAYRADVRRRLCIDDNPWVETIPAKAL